MNDLARQKLCEIVATYKRAVCDDPKRLRALLADLCPGQKREVHALAIALEQHITKDLLTFSSGQPWEVVAGRLVARLVEDAAMAEPAARWAVESWALALGKIPPQEIERLPDLSYTVDHTSSANVPPATIDTSRPTTTKRLSLGNIPHYFPAVVVLLLFVGLLSMILAGSLWPKTSKPGVTAKSGSQSTGHLQQLAEVERHVTEKQYDRAITLLDDVIRSDNTNAKACFLRGEAYRGKHQYDLAIQNYAQALQLDGTFVKAYLGRAKAYYDIGQTFSAMNDIERAVKIDPKIEDPEVKKIVTSEVARIGTKRNDLTDTLDAMAALSNFPAQMSEAEVKRGNEQMAKRSFDQAILFFNRAIKLNDKNANAYFGRGSAHRSIKEYDLAIADYGKAVELEPKDYVSRWARGTCYAETKQLDKAIADYDAVLAIQPNWTQAYSSRASVHYQKSQYSKAIDDLSKALQHGDNRPVVYYSRAMAYHNLAATEKRDDDWERAIADYSKVINLTPKDKLAYYWRGQAYLSTRKYRQAIADFSRALELDPSYMEAQSARNNTEKLLTKVLDSSGR